MFALYLVTGLALLASFLCNRQKSFKALRLAFKKFSNVFPYFILVIIIISVSLFIIPNEMIASYLGQKNIYLSTLFASFIGSIAVMPGFVAFPLSSLLIAAGTPYTVIAAFTTTLMLVGLLSYPLEQKLLGTKITIIRNLISYLIAAIVTLTIGLFFGELP